MKQLVSRYLPTQLSYLGACNSRMTPLNESHCQRGRPLERSMASSEQFATMETHVYTVCWKLDTAGVLCVNHG